MRACMWDFVDRNLILKRETIENIIFFFVYTTHTKQMRLILSLFGHVWQVKTPHNCAGPVNDMKSVFVIIILFKVDTCVYACASSFRLLSLVWIYFVRTCVCICYTKKSQEALKRRKWMLELGEVKAWKCFSVTRLIFTAIRCCWMTIAELHLFIFILSLILCFNSCFAFTAILYKHVVFVGNIFA